MANATWASLPSQRRSTTRWTTRSRSIDHAPDGTLDDIRRKDAQFRHMQESEDYRHGQQVADAWCAAFVWPKRPGEADALTTDTLRRLRENSNALAPAQREETERIADAFQFFHWHLAFPGAGFGCDPHRRMARRTSR